MKRCLSPLFRLCLALLFLTFLWTPAPLLAQEGAGDTGETALVIVDGSGDVQNHCVAVNDGATGWDLLVGAGVAVNSEPSAMGNTICAINGVGCSSPRESCFCQCQGSPCVYWSYWMQNESGDWIYSNQGASNAKARPGEVHAWVWGDGTTGKAPEPPPVAFSDICGGASVDSTTEVSTSVASASVDGSSADSTPTTDHRLPTTDVQTHGRTDAQSTSFPWTLLLVLAPLPLILLVLLRKR